MANTWYKNEFFWDDLASLLGLCQYNPILTKNEQNYLKEQMGMNELSFTPCEVLQASFYLIYYRDYTNGAKLEINLLLQNEMNENQPCQVPSNPFLLDLEEKKAMNIWCDVI